MAELRSGSRRHEIAKARWIVPWIAVKELGYSDANVARYLGVTASCINRKMAPGKRPKVNEYLKKLRTFCTNVKVK